MIKKTLDELKIDVMNDDKMMIYSFIMLNNRHIFSIDDLLNNQVFKCIYILFKIILLAKMIIFNNKIL